MDDNKKGLAQKVALITSVWQPQPGMPIPGAMVVRFITNGESAQATTGAMGTRQSWDIAPTSTRPRRWR